MKKILFGLIIGLGLTASMAYAATSVFNSNQVGNSASNGFILQTSGATSPSTWVPTSNIADNNWVLVNGSLVPTTTIGIIVSASSTIGNGTQAGGLTISGGSTTTLNAYFAKNVGIGTTSPIASLDIGGQVGVMGGALGSPELSISANTNQATGVQMSNTSTGTSADFRFIIFDGTGHYVAFSQPGTGNNSTLFGQTRSTIDTLFSNAGTARTLAIGTIQSADVILGTANTERVRISATGNVGIGTSTPAKLFSFAGTTGLFASTTATSTFQGGGINLITAAGNTGCFAINNTCIGGGGGSGTVTSITAATPNSTLTLGGTNPITTSGTINFDINLTNPNTWTGVQTFGTHILKATSPEFVTSLDDTNGNKIIGLLPAASSVNYLTITNAATTFSPVIEAQGSDANVNIQLVPQGTGALQILDGIGGSVVVGSFTRLLSTIVSAFSVATTSPTAFQVKDGFGTPAVTVNTASTTGPILTVQATSTSDTLFSVDQYGHLMASSTPKSPTVSSCGSGSPALTAGSNDVTGDVTTGTSASTCTITFGQPYTVTPEVLITDSNTTAVVDISSRSTTAFTISLASALSAVNISYFVIQP